MPKRTAAETTAILRSLRRSMEEKNAKITVKLVRRAASRDCSAQVSKAPDDERGEEEGPRNGTEPLIQRRRRFSRRRTRAGLFGRSGQKIFHLGGAQPTTYFQETLAGGDGKGSRTAGH